MKQKLIFTLIAISILVLFTAFSCPPPEELPEEEWKVSEVRYYIDSSNLSIFISNELDQHSYYYDEEKDKHVNFEKHIEINNHTFSFECLVDNQFNFESVTPTLDATLDATLDVNFDTETWFYKVYDGYEISRPIVAKCRFKTDSKFITFKEY